MNPSYETMDWEAEAKRVAAAFGIEGECRFVASGYGQMFLRDAIIGTPIVAGVRIDVMYSSFVRDFVLFAETSSMATHLTLKWDERHPFRYGYSEFVPQLCKGIFHLDLLTPEVEAALKVSISAHQKIEWTLEYEARMEVQSAT